LKVELILAIIVGLALFLSDLAFGWLTMISGPIPVIFIMALLIGIIAGGIGKAVLCTLVSWVFGLLIGTLTAPILLADVVSPSQDFFTLFIIVFLYSLRGMYSFTYEGNIIEVLVTGLLYLIVMMIFTPVIYLMSFIFSALGGYIGIVIRRTRSKPQETTQPATQAPADIPDIQ
jgi:hypothetical protein